MKKHTIYIYVLLSVFVFAGATCAETQLQIEPVSNNENLPRIELNGNFLSEKEVKPLPIKKQEENKPQKRPVFNPKKNSGMTNYQYDDTYYKYNKYEKFVKDNIDYSQTGSTKLY